MAERLQVIKLRPSVVVDASGPLGGSTDLLWRAYPEARHFQLLPPGVAPAPPAAPRPWWSRWRSADSQTRARPEQMPHGASFPPGVELMWSNLALGMDPDPPGEIARWHEAVVPGGFVMFSALGPDTLRELADLYRHHGWGPPSHAQTDMHDYGDMLVRAGFADPVMDQERLRLTWADPDALLRDLRAAGANVHPERFAGCRTPRWRTALSKALGTLAGTDGRIALTVEIAYGHAFRAESRAGRAAKASISVEELRQTARTFQSPIAQPPGKGPDLS
jgi:malonyl-CoA O-methyltransferase